MFIPHSFLCNLLQTDLKTKPLALRCLEAVAFETHFVKISYINLSTYWDYLQEATQDFLLNPQKLSHYMLLLA